MGAIAAFALVLKSVISQLYDMRKQQIITTILIAVLVAVATHRAMQPDAGLLKFRAAGNLAYGNGNTNGMSVSMVRRFLDDNPQVDTLVMGKMPGTRDADMNTRIAREIRKRGLKTHLPKNGFIASGAVDLFLAGVERTMECGALIGVHSWGLAGDRTGTISPKTLGVDRRQKFHEAFLRDMGIDPAFYVYTRDSAEPNDMHYMSLKEIKRWGLLTQPPECEAWDEE